MPNLFRRSRGVGDVNPKSVTWNFEQLSSRRRLLFSQPLPDDHKTTLSIPAVELQLEFSHRIVLIQISPGLDLSGLPFQPASQSCHHDVGQTPLFQKAQQGLIKEPRIRAHSPNSLTLRQKRQRFFQKLHHPARRAAVPTAQPAMQNEVRFRQNRQQGMMRGASVFARIRSLQRSLLSSVAFKHGGIQVQAVAPFPLGQSPHLPRPRRVESVILVGAETGAVAPKCLQSSVPSPRHITRSVRISRTTRSCTLHDKSYGAYRVAAVAPEDG